MFLVGHAAWAYVISRSLASVLRVRINPYIVMLLGMVPDADILLQEYIRHRSLTHSIIFWSIIFIPFFIIYRKRSIPYFIAVIQHIMLGDVIVASTNVLWPWKYEMGMGFSLLSPLNIVMESIGLGLALLLIIKYDRVIIARSRGNILGLVVILPLLGSMLYLFTTNGLFFLDHIIGSSINTKGMIIRGSQDMIVVAMILHASFSILLSVSILQGMRALLTRMH
ncbi:MAG: metal-dependent hydrolase [Candidatus Nitrosocaldus sp.]